jgi:AraC-like DNA-binding protein
MRRVLEYIEENLDSDLSLEAMAAEVDISPIYLVRAFKAAVGQSPHRYVLGRRVERAEGAFAEHRYACCGCCALLRILLSKPPFPLVPTLRWRLPGGIPSTPRALPRIDFCSVWSTFCKPQTGAIP